MNTLQKAREFWYKEVVNTDLCADCDELEDDSPCPACEEAVEELAILLDNEFDRGMRTMVQRISDTMSPYEFIFGYVEDILTRKELENIKL